MNSLPHTGRDKTDNPLWDYVQSLSPEAIAKLSQPNPEVAQVMERSIAGMLGTLPPEGFDVAVTTSRENLSKLLVSAMMNGYFLNSAHQRMAFDRSLQAVHTDDEVDGDE